jgi:hypothetical protein
MDAGGGGGLKSGWRLIGDTSTHVGQCWQAAFSLALVGVVLLLWLMIMAYKVYAED